MLDAKLHPVTPLQHSWSFFYLCFIYYCLFDGRFILDDRFDWRFMLDYRFDWRFMLDYRFDWRFMLDYRFVGKKVQGHPIQHALSSFNNNTGITYAHERPWSASTLNFNSISSRSFIVNSKSSGTLFLLQQKTYSRIKWLKGLINLQIKRWSKLIGILIKDRVDQRDLFTTSGRFTSTSNI